MSLLDLLGLMKRLGLSTTGVEDRVSAALTRIMANATTAVDE